MSFVYILSEHKFKLDDGILQKEKEVAHGYGFTNELSLVSVRHCCNPINLNISGTTNVSTRTRKFFLKYFRISNCFRSNLREKSS